MSFGPRTPFGAGPTGFAGLRRRDDDEDDPDDGDDCPCPPPPPSPGSHLIEAVAIAAVGALCAEFIAWGVDELRERFGSGASRTRGGAEEKPKDVAEKKEDDKKDGSSG